MTQLFPAAWVKGMVQCSVYLYLMSMGFGNTDCFGLTHPPSKIKMNFSVTYIFPNLMFILVSIFVQKLETIKEQKKLSNNQYQYFSFSKVKKYILNLFILYEKFFFQCGGILVDNLRILFKLINCHLIL
jgi:hypothetical protein